MKINPESMSTLVDILDARANAHADRDAVVFTADGEQISYGMSYAQLVVAVRKGARQIESLAAPGERLLLVYHHGPDFVIAFLACLYARVIAVPVYPPRPNREPTLLRAVNQDCAPVGVLTEPTLLNVLCDSWEKIGVAVEAFHVLDRGSIQAWDEGQCGDLPRTEDIAFLQYTSGSTGRPKGVMVNHANLMVNNAQIAYSSGRNETSTMVSWLPLYHDMGLIGHLINPLYLGNMTVLMSPMRFIQRPVRWLRAITRFRGHSAASPNFGYQACIDRIDETQKQGLDLSSWKVALNGSEPVRAETLERFCTSFADSGFSPGSFFPCYGMAETTLFVSGSARPVAERLLHANSAMLEKGRIQVDDEASATSRSLVSCGPPTRGMEVRCVTPEGSLCGDDEVGEIYLRGANVATGYWQHGGGEQDPFRTTLDDRDWFRSGDLGVLHHGDLYITGRVKDMIIVDGRNHYPHDIEATVAACHASIRNTGVAAFSLRSQDRECLVVVVETKRGEEQEAMDMLTVLRSAVAAQHELGVSVAVLTVAGGVPRTTSGKLRRKACAQQLLAGELEVHAMFGDLAAMTL